MSKCKYENLSSSNDMCDSVTRWRSHTSNHYTQIYLLLLYDGWATAHSRNSVGYGEIFLSCLIFNSYELVSVIRHSKSSGCRRGNDLPMYRVTANIFYKEYRRADNKMVLQFVFKTQLLIIPHSKIYHGTKHFASSRTRWRILVSAAMNHRLS